MTLRLATTSLQPQPAPVGGQWLDLKTAARRAVKSEGHLRRLCGGKWLAQGLARQREGRWEVHSSADSALARVPSREVIDDQLDLRHLTDRQRQKVLLREEICRQWDVLRYSADLGSNLADLVDPFRLHWQTTRGIEFSARTLHRWHGDWRARGRAGLLDERSRGAAKVLGADKASPSADGADDRSSAFYEALKDWYLASPPVTKRIAWRLACKQARNAGWPAVSYGQAARFLRGLPAAQVTAARRGDKAFDDAHAAYTDRDYTRFVPPGEAERAMRSNDLWCSDHHECDVIVQTGWRIDHKTGERTPIYRRPWLTAWQDVHSRRIVGWLIRAEDPNSTAVIESLINALDRTDRAVPRMVLIDNGKDYDSYAVQGITKKQRFKLQRRKVHTDFDPVCAGALRLIGADVQHALPFNAKTKPIERWFETFEDQFGRLWPTYCGNSPATKPERLGDVLAAGTQVPTLQQFVEAAAEYIEQVFHREVHTGQGMEGRTPDQVYTQGLVEPRVVRDETVELLRHKMGVPVKVGRNGVTVKGITYGRLDPILRGWHGRDVIVAVDMRDVTRAIIWTTAGEIIGPVRAHKLMPFGAVPEEQVQRAQRAQRRHNQALKQVRRHGLRPHTDPLEMLVEDKLQQAAQQAAGDAPRGPRPPGGVEIVSTGLEDQLIAMRESTQQRARMQLRPAVGAERTAEDFYSSAADDELPAAEQPALRINLYGEDE